MRLAPHALVILLLLACAAQAGAGPVRERLAERRAQQQEQREPDDGYGGAARRNVPAGVKLIADVAYGSARSQRFDVYTPRGAAGAPVIFMVHGGGWKRGDKAADTVVENKVAYWSARGFVVVSTNYRMLPEADPLTQARDVALAVAAARQQAASWGADRDKFILMGHSAGAHLVALIASTPALQGDARWLGTVALDSAAFDVELIMQGRHMRLYDAPFGTDPAYWKSVSPTAQVGSGARPLLAVCSTRRDDACAQAERYAARARALGNRVELLPQDLSHKDINGNLGQPGAYTEAVARFIDGLLSTR
jgi:arylformamidase